MTSSNHSNNELIERTWTLAERLVAAPSTASAAPGPHVEDQVKVNQAQETTKAAPAVSPASQTPSLGATPAEERAEIVQRIAAFRNLQIKLKQDRERYYDQTLARARALLARTTEPKS